MFALGVERIAVAESARGLCSTAWTSAKNLSFQKIVTTVAVAKQLSHCRVSTC